ncbi:hypothetical protein [Aminivibrio sp.]|uniref:hypothetical protein n=1 Tax=Aminivibrio sp. TaxID=1872489 RepID=UPI00345EFDB5
MPSFVSIPEAKTHARPMSKELALKPGSIVALDRGYVDFGQFRAWTDRGVFFVTRMKDNCVYSVDKVRPLPGKRSCPFRRDRPSYRNGDGGEISGTPPQDYGREP